MWGGKTEYLFMTIPQNAPLFKPSVDTRDKDAVISTHNGDTRPAIPIRGGVDLLQRVHEISRIHTLDIIGIDEVHMLSDDITPACLALVARGLHICAVGLSTDYLGRVFQPMMELMALADVVNVKKSICAVCGQTAIHNHCKFPSDARILPGAEELYEPRCRRCFDPYIHRCPETLHNSRCEFRFGHTGSHKAGGVRWEPVLVV